MNRASDGDRSTLLSFVSCGAVGAHEHGLADHAGVRHSGARPDRLCARASLVTVVFTRHTPPVTDCAGDGVPTNGNHMVASCVSASRLNLLSQDDPPHFLLLLPQAVRDGQALCHLSRQDTSREVPSHGRHEDRQE